MSKNLFKWWLTEALNYYWINYTGYIKRIAWESFYTTKMDKISSINLNIHNSLFRRLVFLCADLYRWNHLLCCFRVKVSLFLKNDINRLRFHNLESLKVEIDNLIIISISLDTTNRKESVHLCVFVWKFDYNLDWLFFLLLSGFTKWSTHNYVKLSEIINYERNDSATILFLQQLCGQLQQVLLSTFWIEKTYIYVHRNKNVMTPC